MVTFDSAHFSHLVGVFATRQTQNMLGHLISQPDNQDYINIKVQIAKITMSANGRKRILYASTEEIKYLHLQNNHAFPKNKGNAGVEI